MEEPCGIALIGASLPRRVAAWERTQGAVVEITQGFTLLEIAIVLMVIGLIVGGILWGAEMIGQAATRAQITQLEKFNSAANTFVTKYGYLPGDIPDPYASQFGFQARGANPGQGDGNGILQGTSPSGNYLNGTLQTVGENVTFWADLAAAGFIGGTYLGKPATAPPNNQITGTSIAQYFPAAQTGHGNYVYTYSFNNLNYFGVSIITDVGVTNRWDITSTAGMTVSQAYAIDKKIDDGLPTSGQVLAIYLNGYLWSDNPVYANGNAAQFPNTGDWYPYPLNLFANPASSSSCFDNGNNSANTLTYSMTQNNGSGLNCALSFQMQGAAR